MEIHRQTCQSCHSREMQNILVREPGVPSTVYARCAKCGELVALYRLSDYYHHGKDLESYLRSHGVSSGESGRDILADFQRTQKEAEEGFQRVLEFFEMPKEES